MFLDKASRGFLRILQIQMLIGMFMLLEHTITDWQYWVFLIFSFMYGIANYSEAANFYTKLQDGFVEEMQRMIRLEKEKLIQMIKESEK